MKLLQTLIEDNTHTIAGCAMLFIYDSFWVILAFYWTTNANIIQSNFFAMRIYWFWVSGFKIEYDVNPSFSKIPQIGVHLFLCFFFIAADGSK